MKKYIKILKPVFAAAFFCACCIAPIAAQQTNPKPANKPAAPAKKPVDASGAPAPSKTVPPAAKTPAPAAAQQTPSGAAAKNIPAPAAADMEAEVLDVEAYKPKGIDTTQTPAVIAFGSCNKLNLSQDMWGNVAANNPNLWIWLGDIIYADTTDMKALAAHYKRLKTHSEYKKLRGKAQVIGVYDDHDYGVNDGCKNYPMKKQSKKCLMDFMDVPMNAPLRKREGAYQSYTFGKGGQRVKVIVLDTRYFRDELTPDPSKKRRYLPNMDGDVLGETQWKWLERELRSSQANLNILCSSVQVIADEHGFEKWGNFPNARKRLLNLIAQTKPKNLLILSGDRHMAEISKMDLQGLPYPLYDFTSSGMTHIRSGDAEANKTRVGNMIVKRNFGVLKIQWVGDKPVVTMQVRGQKNELYQETVARY